MAARRRVYLRLSPENFAKVDNLLLGDRADRASKRQAMEQVLSHILRLSDYLDLHRAILEQRHLVVIVE